MFRWFALATLLACLGISAYHRYRARLESETIPRGREGVFLPAIRVLSGLILLVAILAHILSPSRMIWATFSAPEGVPWVGAVLGLLTIPASYWVFDSLGRNVSETVLTKKQHELVTAGPYHWVRHPLYTTGLTLLVAIGLMLSSWLVLLLAFIAFVMMRFFVIPLEEVELLSKFDDRYRTYMLRTGRLLPRIRGCG